MEGSGDSSPEVKNSKDGAKAEIAWVPSLFVRSMNTRGIAEAGMDNTEWEENCTTHCGDERADSAGRSKRAARHRRGAAGAEESRNSEPARPDEHGQTQDRHGSGRGAMNS